jgi:hypothetical protein
MSHGTGRATNETQEHSDRKAPGFWFYTADYERDMQILSLAAQGLWSRMLCWGHENEAHRGFLELPTGQPMTKWDIASRVGKTVREIERCIMEMERIGTFSTDARGCIYSRRMARDTHISEVRREAAKHRLEASKRAAGGTFAGEFVPPKQPAKDEQKPTVTASDSASASASVLTLTPPTPQGGIRAVRSRRRKTVTSIAEAETWLGLRLPWWEEFWSFYPCREGKLQGMIAYGEKVVTEEIRDKVLNGAKAYARKIAADPTAKVKYSQGWLNGERWEDEVSSRTSPAPARSFESDVANTIRERITQGERPW